MASSNLRDALIRAGTLASGAALLAAVFAPPAAAAQPVDNGSGTPPQATQQQQRELKVEAFGDSYFTGVGAGHYTRPDARRQSRAAGFLQALSRLEAANPGLSVTVNNHSAIGATVDNLYETEMVGGLLGQNMPMNAPQLQGVDPTADVAIMGFGGNDVGFVDAIMSCFGADGPLRNLVDERLAGQLNNSLAPEAYLADAARPHGQQQTLIGELVRGIQDLKAAMPNAKVVVTTYPEAVDPNSTSMFSVVSSTELATFRELARALNQAIRQAADMTGATVADNADAFAGHEVYTDDPYLHDLGPQWQRDDRDEAMHPNAAGQTVMSDAIADALSKATGLKPAAPRTGTEPFPTDGLDYVPRQPAIPAQEEATPDPISWSPDEQSGMDPGNEQPGDGPAGGEDPAGVEDPASGEVPGGGVEGPAGGAEDPADGVEGPADGVEDPDDGPGGPPVVEVPEPGDGVPGDGAPEDLPPSQPPTVETPPTGGATPPSGGQDPLPEQEPDGSSEDGSSAPDKDQPPADNDGPADTPENGGDRDEPVGPADNPENGGDRDQPGGIVSGPADNPENGGDRDQPGSHDGPADNPANGGDRGEPGGGSVGPADNPENGGDRDSASYGGESSGGSVGPADNPENGGDRDSASYGGESGGGSVGPADNPDNGGDRDSSSYGGGSVGSAHDSNSGGDRDGASYGGVSDSSGGSVGPADNPDNGGDRDSASYGGESSGGSVGPADNPENGGDRDSSSYGGESGGGSFGPADNPENGGDRDSPGYGGWGGDPSTPVS